MVFFPSIPRFRFLSDLPADVLQDHLVHGGGAVIVEEARYQPLAAAMRGEVLQLVGEERAAGTLIDADGCLRPRNVINRFLGDLLNMHDDLTRLARGVLGSAPVLSSFGANVVVPDAPGQGMHRDYPYFSMPESARPRQMPVMSMQCILALDHFWPNNAPTLLVPGSHDSNAWIPQAEFEARAVPVLMPQGAMVIFHGAVAHGVKRNWSIHHRAAMLFGFTPHWIRPLSDLPARAGRNVTCFEEMQSLLGLDFKKRVRQDMSRMGYGMAKPK